MELSRELAEAMSREHRASLSTQIEEATRLVPGEKIDIDLADGASLYIGPFRAGREVRLNGRIIYDGQETPVEDRARKWLELARRKSGINLRWRVGSAWEEKFGTMRRELEVEGGVKVARDTKTGKQIQGLVLDVIETAYRAYRQRPGAREPVMSVSAIRSDLAQQSSSPEAFREASTKEQSQMVQRALDALVRQGKLQSSLARGVRRAEVRAYEPSGNS